MKHDTEEPYGSNDEQTLVTEIRRSARQFWQSDNDTDEGFQAMCAIWASLLIGPDVERIARLLEFPPLRLEQWAANLRSGHIWCSDGSVNLDGCNSESARNIDMILATLVALGKVTRTFEWGRGWVYRATPDGPDLDEIFGETQSNLATSQRPTKS